MKKPFQTLPFTCLGSARSVSALLGTVALALATPTLLAAPGGKGKPGGGGGGGGGGGEDPPPTAGAVTVIPMPDGAVDYYLGGLNDLGQAVGSTDVSVGRRESAWGPAVLWTGTEMLTLQPLLGDESAHAYEVAETETGTLLVCGFSNAGTEVYLPDTRAVWWAGDPGSMTVGDWNELLPADSTLNLTEARAVTSDGKYVLFVVGPAMIVPDFGTDIAIVAEVSYDEASGAPLALDPCWEIGPVELEADEVIVPNDLTLGVGLDASGQETAFVRACGSAASRGFMWELDLDSGDATWTEFDLYPGVDPGYASSDCTGVNRVGAVALLGWQYGSYTKGYFWSGDPLAAPVSLDGADGSDLSARAIDPLGVIVGDAGTGNDAFAFLWTSGSGLVPLNALVTTSFDLRTSTSINASGQILAWGYDSAAKKQGSRYVIVEPNGNW